MGKILQAVDKTPVAEVARKHPVSNLSISDWHKRSEAPDAPDVKRLLQL